MLALEPMTEGPAVLVVPAAMVVLVDLEVPMRTSFLSVAQAIREVMGVRAALVVLVDRAVLRSASAPAA